MKSNILDLLLAMANVLNLGDFDTYENRYDILTYEMIKALNDIANRLKNHPDWMKSQTRYFELGSRWEQKGGK